MFFFVFLKVYKCVLIFYFIIDSLVKLNRNLNSVFENIGDFLSDFVLSVKVYFVYFFLKIIYNILCLQIEIRR